MDQQGTQVAVPLLADAAESPGVTGAVFPGRNTEPAGKGTATFERMDIGHTPNQGGGGDGADAVNGLQSYAIGFVGKQCLEIAIHVLQVVAELNDVID